jgi:hypothetical protein
LQPARQGLPRSPDNSYDVVIGLEDLARRVVDVIYNELAQKERLVTLRTSSDI